VGMNGADGGMVKTREEAIISLVRWSSWLSSF